MADVGVRIEGLDATVRALSALGAEVADLEGAFRKVGEQVTGTAQGLVHSRSGDLAASIRPVAAKDRATILAGSPTVPYAGPINYGWRAHHIEPQRFLQRAAEIDQDRVPEILSAELSEIIRKLDL